MAFSFSWQGNEMFRVSAGEGSILISDIYAQVSISAGDGAETVVRRLLPGDVLHAGAARVMGVPGPGVVVEYRNVRLCLACGDGAAMRDVGALGIDVLMTRMERGAAMQLADALPCRVLALCGAAAEGAQRDAYAFEALPGGVYEVYELLRRAENG